MHIVSNKGHYFTSETYPTLEQSGQKESSDILMKMTLVFSITEVF